MIFTTTIQTGAGYWNPIIWLFSFGLISILIYIIFTLIAEKSYKKDTEQTLPFLSGNIEEREEKLHVKASNLYWGFKTSLEDYYKFISKLRLGSDAIINDYFTWFIFTLAVIFLIIFGGMLL